MVYTNLAGTAVQRGYGAGATPHPAGRAVADMRVLIEIVQGVGIRGDVAVIAVILRNISNIELKVN